MQTLVKTIQQLHSCQGVSIFNACSDYLLTQRLFSGSVSHLEVFQFHVADYSLCCTFGLPFSGLPTSDLPFSVPTTRVSASRAIVQRCLRDPTFSCFSTEH